MLINKLIKIVLLYITLIYSHHALAVVTTPHYTNLGSLTIDGPADKKKYVESIGSTGHGGSHTICNSTSVSYNLGRIEYIPKLTPIGTYQASSAHNIQQLFDLNIIGLAISPTYITDFINQPGFMQNTGLASVGPTQQTLWSGNVENSNRPSSGLNWIFQVWVYKGADQIQSGVYQVPETITYSLNCYDTSGNLQEIHDYIVMAFQVTVNVSSCTPNEMSKIINMDGIPLSTINDAEVGTLLGTKQQNFSLTCDPNISLKMSINDLVDSSNIGGKVSKIMNGGATGVGYVVSSSSAPDGMIFSPQGSTSGVPNLIQYQITSNTGTSEQNIVNHSLNFSYTKTNNLVTEGKVHSIIGITYSYQ